MAAPNNPFPLAAAGADSVVARPIRQASDASHCDFGLLMAEAAQESGFHADAKASTGSAAGLYQFVASTWLDMMHRFGTKYGEGVLARQITVDDAGRPHVADAAVRRQILALRDDPKLSAALAGEYANLNRTEVARALGHAPNRTDLYMAHFLGPAGATTFLKALETKGTTPAAKLLPEAAANNRSVFYDGDTGRARSVAEIYRALGGHIEQEAQDFAAAPDKEIAARAGDVMDAAATAATGAAGTALRQFAGLTLSQPVAALLDTLTLAALRLVGAPAATTPPAHPRHTDTPS
jgi:Transglycosylase SLT domain